MESLFKSQNSLKPQLIPFNRRLDYPVSKFSFFFVSRSWKLKEKLLAVTGNVFTLAFWLPECLCILYKIKPFFFEEFIIENPAHDTLHTSVSEV